MSFNVDKCKVMHFGRRNSKAVYCINDTQLHDVQVERDLGVLVQSDMKVSPQCSNVVKICNKILGLIYRSFTLKSKDAILSLYKALVRPRLEYCVQVWRPHLKKDIELLEGVQRRATRMIEGFKNLTYSERVDICNLTTLETRRLRGDLIELFKIVKGFEGTGISNLNMQSYKTSERGYMYKLCKIRFWTDTEKFNFANRVVDEWNVLPSAVVESSSVNIFKNRLDCYLRLL